MKNRIVIALFIAVYIYTVMWLEHRITVLERIAMDFTIEFRYKSHFPAVGEFGTIQLYKEDAKKVNDNDWDLPKIMPL